MSESGHGWLSPPEVEMRETIAWLLALPEDERLRMAEAATCSFTLESPAPQQEPPASAAGAERTEPSRSPLQPPPRRLVATICMGSVEAALLLCQQGLRPAVLNFAHGYNCGGGFEHSGGSQEEDIFRKTSLFLSLWPRRRADDGPGVLARGMWIGDFDKALPRAESFYPHSACGGIYSKHVRLVRQVGRPGHPLCPAGQVKECPCFSVITVAAQDVGRDGTFVPALLRDKVRTLLHVAAAHGDRALVLGAFGCGYFRNPPEDVAEAFSDLLHSEFAGCFDVVLFAVPDRVGPKLDAFNRRFPVRTPETLLSILPPHNAPQKSTGSQTCAGRMRNLKRRHVVSMPLVLLLLVVLVVLIV
ncbi:unnamed protein product [Polarella glacialis]|uniref:Microbial-type PARG catalytic domain-containing protein n=1 Tax=Polarella glacialis TaxID=89957 RepID=A0A813G2W0_POLGL|nr:unnamed protein product [Polarella glacialis]CAE8645195.1 unnamed protein product [Polarella glacialis]